MLIVLTRAKVAQLLWTILSLLQVCWKNYTILFEAKKGEFCKSRNILKSRLELRVFVTLFRYYTPTSISLSVNVYRVSIDGVINENENDSLETAHILSNEYCFVWSPFTDIWYNKTLGRASNTRPGLFVWPLDFVH